MQKKTHMLFAILLFLVVYSYIRISPVLALFIAFGAYFPDIDYLLDKKYIPKIIKGLTWKPLFKRGMHRTLLHNVWALAVSSFLFFKLSNNFLFAVIFGLGFFSHLIMDSFTKTGVYWLWPLGDEKVFKKKFLHFKGRMTTGSSSEKMFQLTLNTIIVLVLLRWILKF